jgi:hypothetical protein
MTVMVVEGIHAADSAALAARWQRGHAINPLAPIVTFERSSRFENQAAWPLNPA